MRSSGTSAAPSPSPSSRPPRILQRSNSAQHHRRSTSSALSTSSGKGVSVALQHVSPEYPERRPSLVAAQTDNSQLIRGNCGIDQFGGITTSTSGSLGGNIGPSVATPTTTPTTVLQPNSSPGPRFHPSLRLHSHLNDAVPQPISILISSPQRRTATTPFPSSLETNPSITTPLTGTSEGSHLCELSLSRLRTDSGLLPASTLPPVARANAEDLLRVPELIPESPPRPISSLVRSHFPEGAIVEVGDSPKARIKEHKSYSQKAMLSSALAKANTAVQLDNAENYEGAMEAYGDACVLLGQVMMRAGGDEDRKKLQAIVGALIPPATIWIEPQG